MAQVPLPVAFGAFVLDPARRLLMRNSGEPVPISGKAFDALVFLIAHAGEVISRRALSAALWSGSIVVDNSVTQVIRALRQALGDAGPPYNYITTIPRRGYQFIAQVIEPPSSIGLVSDPSQAQPDAPSAVEVSPVHAVAQRYRPVVVAALSILALNAAAVGALAMQIHLGIASRVSASRNPRHGVAECRTLHSAPACAYGDPASTEWPAYEPARKKTPGWEEERHKVRTLST